MAPWPEPTAPLNSMWRHEMKLLTLDVVARAMLNTDLEDEAEALCKAIGVMVEDLGAVAGVMLNSPATFSPSRNAQFQAALDTADRIAYGLIEERRAQDPEAWPRDVLSVMLRARDEQDKPRLSDVQLRDEIITMLLAGHENDGHHARLGASSRGASSPGSPGTSPRGRHRVGRASARVGRLAAPCSMRDGSQRNAALVSARLVHGAPDHAGRNGGGRFHPGQIARDGQRLHHAPPPGVLDEPDEFRPARFAPETAREQPLYAYFPFAGGRHLCLGQRFALIEATLALATLVDHFEVQPRCPSARRASTGADASPGIRRADANSFPFLIMSSSLRAPRTGWRCCANGRIFIPDRPAVTFLPDGEGEGFALSFAELEARARAVAAQLQEHGAGGERVLLALPSSLEFITAFFGCLFAGAVAVPAYPPRSSAT